MATVLVIGGATATGKTALSVALARSRGDVELLNADSRQVLRGLSVATMTPVAADLQGVPAHLFNVANPGDNYTAADWSEQARDAIADIELRHHLACVVGGTGLYIRSLVEGWSLGSVPADLAGRAERERTIAASAGGLEQLADELAERDPEGAANLDRRNPRRVIRALELLDAKGGQLAGARGLREPVSAVQIALDVPRDVHRRLIEERATAMFQGDALLRETQGALDAGISPSALARAGIGYREAIEVLADTITPEQAQEHIVRRTLRYAKSQRTWFRGHTDVHWLIWEVSPIEVLEAALALAPQPTG